VTQSIVVLLLIWGTLLLAQWLAFAWWRRSVAVGLLAVCVVAALASPDDVLRPIGDAVAHLFQARGQGALLRALTILDETAAAMLILGLVLSVRGRVADDAGDDYHYIESEHIAGKPVDHGATLPKTGLGVFWTREVLDRDDKDRSAVATLIRVAVSALGAVAAYYALTAGLVAVYARRGISHAAALPDTNHVQIAFWLFIVGAVGTAAWKARRWREAVHVVLIRVGDREWAVSSWRHGLGRMAVDCYAHPDVRADGASPVALVVPAVPGIAPAGGVAQADMKPRRGWTCQALLIAPPPAGWPPDRTGSPTYAADCAAWYARLQACVDAAHFAPLPTPDGMRGTMPTASPSERVMYKALMHDALPVEHERGVRKDGTRPESRDVGDYRWPDAALRVQGDLLLVCIELDGGDHTRLGRDKNDERRDAFFAGHGWYVARLFTKSWDTRHWPRDLVRDMRRLVTVHEQACRAARGANQNRA